MKHFLLVRHAFQNMSRNHQVKLNSLIMGREPEFLFEFLMKGGEV